MLLLLFFQLHLESGVIIANIEAWQPTINTALLIVLAIVGRKEFRKHRRRTSDYTRKQTRRLREVENVVHRAEEVARRIERLLDESGEETKHLH